MPDALETPILLRVEEVFRTYGIDTARSIPIGNLRADLVAYGYMKGVIVLVRSGPTEFNVSFNAVTEAITLKAHAADALERETVGVLLTTQRVPDAVNLALRDWGVTVIQVTADEDAWVRRFRQEIRDFAVVF